MKKNTVVFAMAFLFLVFTGNLMAQSRNRVEWPDNEYTSQVPRPPFDIKSIGDMSAVMGFIHINFVEATIETIEAYIESVKARGFTIDEVLTKKEGRERDGSITTVIMFDALNSQGWAVSARYLGRNAVTMTIVRPKQ